MANATADKLNSERIGDRESSLSHNDITKQSRATITVGGAGPNSRTEANTKASETEIRAAMDGTFTEKEPVKRVSAARIIHWFETGRTTRVIAENAVTVSPAPMTAVT